MVNGADMFKKVAAYWQKFALRRTASYLRRNTDVIVNWWLDSFKPQPPGYTHHKQKIVQRGRQNISLLLRAMQAETSEETENLALQVSSLGREVAQNALRQKLSLKETLSAWSLFRLAVLNCVEQMLRKRLWIAFPPDVLKAEHRINEFLDRQMLAIAEAYLEARDEIIQDKQLNILSIAKENKRLYEEAKRKAEILSVVISEMHHRIKNNLQTVADLLSLEMLQGRESSAQERLQESIGRVKSIATVHELLSTGGFKGSDIKKISQRILAIASKAGALKPDKKITTTVTGDRAFIPSKEATSLALVLNELISNAFEHAFIGKKEGNVVVKIEKKKPEVVITIQDDGIGISDENLSGNPKGLGLKIAQTLVEKDLKGTLTLSNNQGTMATINFINEGKC